MSFRAESNRTVPNCQRLSTKSTTTIPSNAGFACDGSRKMFPICAKATVSRYLSKRNHERQRPSL